MENNQRSPQARKNKKLVDLIVLDKYQDNTNLVDTYWARINAWQSWVNHQLDRVASQSISKDEQDEVFVVNYFLKNFLVKRIEWILEFVEDQELRHKYLLVLPPFNQQGNIKAFLLHFFRLAEQEGHQSLQYSPLSESEKEVRILWDIYKLIKTIDTVEVLKSSIESPNPFPSRFPRHQVKSTLKTMCEMLNLLIEICVKPDHYKTIRYQFSPELFTPEAILKRKESYDYFVNPVILEKFDYRNYFFHIYFKSSLKAIYKGKDLVFKYNYLDFEIMRQEFLIHWLNERLKNNPKKQEVLNNYVFGQKRFSEVIEKNPDMEIPLLKKLPGHVFNELIAQVNEAVDEKDKVSVDPMSATSGEFSKQFQLFNSAKQLARKTTQAIRESIGSFKGAISKSDQTAKNPSPPSQKAVLDPESTFQIKLLGEEDIEIPFFAEDGDQFSDRLSRLTSALSKEQLDELGRCVKAMFDKVGTEKLVKRAVPHPEWSLPCLIKEKTKYGVSIQLLILGAEIANAGGSDGDHNGIQTPYFVYGSKVRNFEMDQPLENRTVMEKPYFIYNSSVSQVIARAFALASMVITQPLSG